MGANVLYLTYDGLTDPLGRSQVLPYLTGLSARGHRISIISFEKPQRSSEMASVKDICASAGIDWHPQWYHKKPPVLSSLYDLQLMKRAAARLHREKRFDLVHCRSYIPAAVGQWLKQRHDLKFLFDMRGFWADERVEGGLWPQSNRLFRSLYRGVKRLEQQLLRNADHIVSLTRAGKTELLTWPVLSGADDRISVIPCCVDFDHFRLPGPGDREAARRTLGIDDDARVAAYLGSLGTWYMLPEMLDFLREFSQRDSRAHFLIITPDNPADILAEAARRELNPSLFTIRSATRPEIPSFLAAADFGLFFIKPVFSKIASSPTKLGEMLAVGLPVVANSGVGDVAEILQECAGGVIVDRFEPQAYGGAVEAISRAWSGPDIRQNARPWFDLELGIETYDQIYRRLGATTAQLPT